MKILLKIREDLTGWEKTAALFFKKSILPAAALLLLTAAAQLTGVYLVLRRYAAEGFQALPYGQDAVPVPWAPRLEAVMAEGLWFPFSSICLILLMVLLISLPSRLCGGGGTLAAFRRLPISRGGLVMGSFLNAFCWSLCFWAVQFGTLFGSHFLYRTMVPKEIQLPDTLLMALLRWEPLNGLFPAARPWLFPVVLAGFASLALIAACTGFLLGRGKYAALVVVGASLTLSARLYRVGINPLTSWYIWAVLLAGALWILRAMLKCLQEDPLAS